MRKIAIYNDKGGVGKSTTSVNIAYGLSSIGSKVLLLDMDVQNDCADFLGIEKPQNNLNEMFNKGLAIEECIYNARENLDIITNGYLLEIQNLHNINSIEYIFNSIVNNYDYIIIDCSPKPSFLNNFLLAYCDEIYMPVQMEWASVRAIVNFYEYLNYLELPIEKITTVIPNMYNSVTNESKECLETLKELFEENIIAPPIKRRSKISEANRNGFSIFETDEITSEYYINLLERVVNYV